MKTSKLAIGAVVGAAVGVVAGMLTAPKSGAETRQDIKNRAGDLKHKADDKKNEIGMMATDTSDEVITRAEEAFKAVRAKFGKK